MDDDDISGLYDWVAEGDEGFGGTYLPISQSGMWVMLCREKESHQSTAPTACAPAHAAVGRRAAGAGRAKRRVWRTR